MYNNAWGEVSSGEWVFFLVMLAVSILLQFLFLLNLRNLLREVRPQNRAMAPNLVWLNFIPLFSFAWMIYTVVKIRDSVEAEMRSRGTAVAKDPAYRVGMSYAVLSIIVAVVGWSTPGGYLAVAAGLVGLSAALSIASLVLWILYWIRTASLKNGLKHELQYLESSSGYRGFGYPKASAPHPTASSPGGQPSTIECPSCGLLPMPDDEFCRSCGLPIEKPEEPPAEATEYAEGPTDRTGGAFSDTAASVDTTDSTDLADKTCPYCGEAYRPNARYCSSCGRPAP